MPLTVLITGASQGLGLALVEAYAEAMLELTRIPRPGRQPFYLDYQGQPLRW